MRIFSPSESRSAGRWFGRPSQRRSTVKNGCCAAVPSSAATMMSSHRRTSGANIAQPIGEPAWLAYYTRSLDGEFINLAAIEDLLLSSTSPCDSYYTDVDEIPETQCFRRVPTAEQVRLAFQQILVAATHDECSKEAVHSCCGDLLLEVLQLGDAARRFGLWYDEDDLFSCVAAARQSAPDLMTITGLRGDTNIDILLHLLQTPEQLHAVLTDNAHVDVLAVLVGCVKHLLLELTLPSRTQSPADFAIKSEVLLKSSIALVGAKDA